MEPRCLPLSYQAIFLPHFAAVLQSKMGTDHCPLTAVVLGAESLCLNHYLMPADSGRSGSW